MHWYKPSARIVKGPEWTRIHSHLKKNVKVLVPFLKSSHLGRVGALASFSLVTNPDSL
jgi:hypothetical protein